MRLKYFLLSSVLAFFIITDGYSQGLNNEYDIDNVDLVNAFETLGLEIYKFPVKSKESDTYANIIIEKYVDGELVKSINFYEELKPLLAMLDEPLDQQITKLNKKEKWLRFYLHKKDSVLSLISVNGNSKKTTDISLDGYKISGSRGFGNLPEFYANKHRVLTFYANRDSRLISCPGDASPKEIAELYDLAVVVYIEPFQL